MVAVGFAGIGISSRLVCLDKLLQLAAVLSIYIHIKTVKKITASTTFDITKNSPSCSEWKKVKIELFVAVYMTTSVMVQCCKFST